MKKILNIFYFIIFVASFVLIGIQPAKADADQHNLGDINDGWWYIRTHEPVGQTFRPTGDKLVLIEILVNGGGEATSLHMDVYKIGTPDILIASADEPIISSSSWIPFEFSNEPLIPEARYKFVVTTNSGLAYWYCKNNNTYDRGTAIVDGDDVLEQDFDFAMFSVDPYAPESPSPSPSTSLNPVPSPSSTITSAETGDSQLPSENTDPNINKPSNLRIQNIIVNGKNAVKLDWDASSSDDIDGYLVFRSEEEGKGYVSVGKNTKESTTYTDKDLDENKTYYYYIRAYKDILQSASSNIDSIKTSTISVVTPSVNPTLDITKSSQTTNTILLTILVALAIVLVGVLLFLYIKRVKKNNIK